MEIAAPVTGSFFYTDKGKKNDEASGSVFLPDLGIGKHALSVKRMPADKIIAGKKVRNRYPEAFTDGKNFVGAVSHAV